MQLCPKRIPTVVTRERQTHVPVRARKLGLLALGMGTVLLAVASLSSGSFSGALMTSGSFTMQAGGGGDDLHEEVASKPSNNFAGALMTPGSFTMQAASGSDLHEEVASKPSNNFGGALMTSGSFTMQAAGGSDLHEEVAR